MCNLFLTTPISNEGLFLAWFASSLLLDFTDFYHELVCFNQSGARARLMYVSAFVLIVYEVPI